MLDLSHLNEIANRMTFHKARAMAMGFFFDSIKVEPGHFTDRLQLRAQFRCVCGRVEQFQKMIYGGLGSECDLRRIMERELDVAAELHRAGSFSRHHLLLDGYSEQEIQRIEQLGKDFDDAARHALLTSTPGVMSWTR